MTVAAVEIVTAKSCLLAMNRPKGDALTVAGRRHSWAACLVERAAVEAGDGFSGMWIRQYCTATAAPRERMNRAINRRSIVEIPEHVPVQDQGSHGVSQWVNACKFPGNPRDVLMILVKILREQQVKDARFNEVGRFGLLEMECRNLQPSPIRMNRRGL